MDPKIPTSFIPKRPVVAGMQPERGKPRMVGLLSLLTAVVAIATAVSFGFVYLYEKSLSSQKAKLEESIDDARNGVGTDFLADMKRLNARISGVQTLLDRHIVVSPIFSALESTTLRSVQYKNFTYQLTDDATSKTQTVKVTLTGTAKNYSAIALQSDAFAQSSLIKNPVFSGLTVDEKGNISFKLDFDVSPEDLSFVAFLGGTTGGAPLQLQESAVAPHTSQTTQ